jgi:predicted NBD/HSP70 family sugar kinase
VQKTPGTPRLLREINDRAALELLLAHGALSRTQMGALTGLSKPTASQLLARLETAGMVVRVGLLEGNRGPSAQLYQINPQLAYVAGLDINPQRIDLAVADISGRVVAEHVLPTPDRSATGLVSRVRNAIEEATQQIDRTVTDLEHVVIGTPGAINPKTGQLDYARHLPGWHRPGVLDELRANLGVPLDIENDVNLAAIAEGWIGRARGSGNFVLLWVAEGVGLAIVLGGDLHRGATGGAGEVGYLPVPGHPVVRNLGKGADGGFQATAGASAVLRLARSRGIRSRSAVDAVRRAAASAAGSRSGADAAETRQFLQEFATRLATGLAAIVCLLDPELIVLTGDIAMAGGEPLRRLVEEELQSLALPRPRLELSSVTGNPVRAGAIHLALAAARERVFGSTAGNREVREAPQ